MRKKLNSMMEIILELPENYLRKSF